MFAVFFAVSQKIDFGPDFAHFGGARTLNPRGRRSVCSMLPLFEKDHFFDPKSSQKTQKMLPKVVACQVPLRRFSTSIFDLVFDAKRDPKWRPK